MNWADDPCWYVIARKELVGTAWLLGPYRTEEDAERDLPIAKRMAAQMDQSAAEYVYSVVQRENGHANSLFADLLSPHKWDGYSITKGD